MQPRTLLALTALAIATAMLTVACTSETGSTDDVAPEESQDAVPVNPERYNCEQPILKGLDWTSGNQPEGMEGIEQELDDFNYESLPETIDISGRYTSFDRGLIAYALEWHPRTLGLELDRDEVRAVEPMGRAVLYAIGMGSENEPFNIDAFRRGFFRYYSCSREFPASLADFKAIYGDYELLESTDVASVAKCKTRRLRADTESHVYVSETWDGEELVETEVILDNRRYDGALDFIVYGPDGQLTDRSIFPPGKKTELNPEDARMMEIVDAAPFTCMACHASITNDQGLMLQTIEYTQLIGTIGTCSDDV